MLGRVDVLSMSPVQLLQQLNDLRALPREAGWDKFNEPKNQYDFNKLVTDIDGLDWYSAKDEGLGDLYEGLLEKNASEKKSGAGQYFTPRPLIECMVNCIQPRTASSSGRPTTCSTSP